MLALATFASCTSTANRAPSVVPPPPEPVWPKEGASRGAIRAIGREDLPEAVPERILRDLADAAACDKVREELANRAAAGLLRRGGMDSVDARSTRLLAAIRRTPLHGCRISRRDFRSAGAGRRWCWSEAILDSAEIFTLLDRELKKLDPGGARSPDGLLD